MRHFLGQVVATAAVTAAVPRELILQLVDRHAAGDWGDLAAGDKAANNEAARTGVGRFFSSYSTAEHGVIWVITDDCTPAAASCSAISHCTSSCAASATASN